MKKKKKKNSRESANVATTGVKSRVLILVYDETAIEDEKGAIFMVKEDRGPYSWAAATS